MKHGMSTLPPWLAISLFLPLSCTASQATNSDFSDGSVDAASVSDAAVEGPADHIARQEKAVIYFVLTDRFANGSGESDLQDKCFDPLEPNTFHGGDLDGLRQNLDYIQELGATDIWITPVQAQVGPEAVPAELGRQCGFHGYWAALQEPDDQAIEPRVGGAEALQALISEMHSRGMHLIVDYVVNHVGYGAPLAAAKPEWFHSDSNCDMLGNPEETCPFYYLPDFAHERSDVQNYLAGAAQNFLSTFPIDGIRMDTAKHVPLSFFRDVWIPTVREQRPNLYLVGEVFVEDGHDWQPKYLDAGFDAVFDFPLRKSLLQTFAWGGSLNSLAQGVSDALQHLGPQRARLRATFLDNHDVPRFISLMSDAPSAMQVNNYWLALAALFTTPGIPQLYYGDELGMMGFWPENRREMPAWAFDQITRNPHDGYLGDPARNFEVTKRLISVRNQLPALHSGEYVELWRPGGSPFPVYAFLRSTANSRALVVFHTGEQQLINMTIPITGNAYVSSADKTALTNGHELSDALGIWPGATAEFVDGNLVVNLPSHSMAVFYARK